MKYKIKHSYRTTIIEDVAGGVSMDDLIDVFLQEHDSWSEAIYSNFYNYDDGGWHEYGPTDVVDTLVIEDGTEKDINTSVIEISDLENLSDKESLGWEVFFTHSVCSESGEWKFESFELEHEFDEQYLQANRNIDAESILSTYVYESEDEYIDIDGELIESSGKDIDITLYVNTKDGVVECDEFYDWREEMEKEGIDATEKDEIKKYLIKKYNIDIDNNN